MNKLSKDVLFLISRDLEISDLLNFSKSSKRIYEKVFLNNSVWLYKLKHEFPNFLLFKFPLDKLPEKKMNKFEGIYKNLSSLKKVKYGLDYNENVSLLELYNWEKIDSIGEGLNSLPKDLGILINLRELDFSSSRLEKIPPLENLSNLKNLNLSGNRLRFFKLENLVDLEEVKLDNNLLKIISLKNLPKLKKLTLHSNKLKEIPFLENSRDLEYLTLSINKLTNIPDSLGNFTNLKKLYLNHNRILEIPLSIGNLFNLKILTLNDNNLTKIPSTLEKLTNLEELNLLYNPIKDMPLSLKKFLNCDFSFM